ncbi:MAG: hypothetical protein IT558_04460 [Alphaproteobacteria bacterium]|nr:hypothetical protein [Alphaproteobacteria bacterium]
MKTTLSQKLTAVFGAAALLIGFGFYNGRKAGVTAEPASTGAPATLPKRNNLIALIHMLGKTHKYIALADPSHLSPDVQAVFGDKRILQAAKDADHSIIAREGPVDDNKGYDAKENFVDRVQLTEKIRLLQTHLALGTKQNLPITGTLNKKTIGMMMGVVAYFQRHAEWGWDKAKDGIYTEEFDAHMRAKIRERIARTGQSNETSALTDMMNAMAYIRKAGLAIAPTQTTLRQDFCSGTQSPEDYSQTRLTPYHAGDLSKALLLTRAKVDFLKSSCDTSTTVYYPDTRYAELDADPQFYEYIRHINGLMTEDMAYNQIRIDAELNIHPEWKPYAQKLSVFLARGHTPETAQGIADNIRNFVKHRQALVIYGAQHLLENNDVSDRLGKEQTATILLLPHKNFMLHFLYKTQNPPLPLGKLPDYIYDIESDTVTKTEPGTPEAQAYRNKIRTFLTREEYDLRVKQLPPDRQPYAEPYEVYAPAPAQKTSSANLPAPGAAMQR